MGTTYYLLDEAGRRVLDLDKTYITGLPPMVAYAVPVERVEEAQLSPPKQWLLSLIVEFIESASGPVLLCHESYLDYDAPCCQGMAEWRVRPGWRVYMPWTPWCTGSCPQRLADCEVLMAGAACPV